MAPPQSNLDKAADLNAMPQTQEKGAPPAKQNGEVKQNGNAHGAGANKKPSIKVDTEAEKAPVTQERKVFIRAEDDKLTEPGVARSNIAASKENPKGTTKDGWAEKHKNKTVLQQHCEFFDTDGDGIIWPQDTFHGFHRLGFGYFLSFIATLIIHLNFSYPTQNSWIPDPRFLVNVNNIHKDKHGSSTNSFDHEGRFVPQHFEEIFTKYGDGRDYLTWRDLAKVWNGQRMLNDLPGMFGAFFEWAATYLMFWPEDGKLWKEDVRGVYDGSIFYTIADRVEAKQKQKAQ